MTTSSKPNGSCRQWSILAFSSHLRRATTGSGGDNRENHILFNFLAPQPKEGMPLEFGSAEKKNKWKETFLQRFPLITSSDLICFSINLGLISLKGIQNHLWALSPCVPVFTAFGITLSTFSEQPQMSYGIWGFLKDLKCLFNNLRIQNRAYRRSLDSLFKGKHQLQSIKSAIQTRPVLWKGKKKENNTQQQQQPWVWKPGSSLIKPLIPSGRWAR